MGGRIEFSDLSEEEKHPIILPSKSYVVKLIMEDTHRTQLHAGVNQTLISLRDKYWITKSRQSVKSIVKACLICRKHNPVRMQVQQAPLPRERIIPGSPFEVVGVDFTGPFCKSTKEWPKKSSMQTWIKMYICPGDKCCICFGGGCMWFHMYT